MKCSKKRTAIADQQRALCIKDEVHCFVIWGVQARLDCQWQGGIVGRLAARLKICMQGLDACLGHPGPVCTKRARKGVEGGKKARSRWPSAPVEGTAACILALKINSDDEVIAWAHVHFAAAS